MKHKSWLEVFRKTGSLEKYLHLGPESKTKIIILLYLLQLGCYPVAVVILHVYKTWNWLIHKTGKSNRWLNKTV